MAKLKIEEAYRYAKERGYALKKKDLAVKLFPGSNAAKVNLTNLFAGNTKRVDVDVVVTLCKEFGVSADFLFGLSETPTGQENITGSLSALIDTAASALWKAKGELHKYNE